jgi:hypothetical protein
MKITIDIPKNNLLQILVPDNIEKFEIINYGYAGTWIMEKNSKNLNAWKKKLPNGNYEILGRIKDVIVDKDLSEIESDKNFIIRKK